MCEETVSILSALYIVSVSLCHMSYEAGEGASERWGGWTPSHEQKDTAACDSRQPRVPDSLSLCFKKQNKKTKTPTPKTINDAYKMEATSDSEATLTVRQGHGDKEK